MSKLKINYLPLEQLTKYEGNAKLHPQEQVEQIAHSIKEFGFNDPIAIDSDGIIIEGHGRLLAAEHLGIKEVPTITLGDLSDAQRKAYILTHNKLTMNTGFDLDILAQELKDILEEQPDFDLSLTGFDQDEIDGLIEEPVEIEGLTDEDAIPDTPDEDHTVIKFGDLIEFPDGSRIICGDSTDAETFKNLLGEEKARVVNTDPPYGVAYQSDKFEDIANDDLTGDNLQDFLIQNFKLLNRYTVANPALYIYHASRTQMIFEDALNAAGFRVKQQIIWVKNMFAFGRSDYHWKHEPIFYAVKEETNSEWFGNRASTTTWKDDDISDMTKEELLDLLDEISAESTAWEVSKDPTSSYEHPTQKPVALAERAVRNSSKPGEIVLEPFSGSGSTLLGCIKTGRRGMAIEFEPKYVQVACQRVRDYTGDTSMIINGKEIHWDNLTEGIL